MPGNHQWVGEGAGDVDIDNNSESLVLLATHSADMDQLNTLYGRPRKIWVPPSSPSSSRSGCTYSNVDRHMCLTGSLSSASSSPLWPSMPSTATSRSSPLQTTPSCTPSPRTNLSRPGSSSLLPLLFLWRPSPCGLSSSRHSDRLYDLAGRRET